MRLDEDYDKNEDGAWEEQINIHYSLRGKCTCMPGDPGAPVSPLTPFIPGSPFMHCSVGLGGGLVGLVFGVGLIFKKRKHANQIKTKADIGVLIHRQSKINKQVKTKHAKSNTPTL